MGKGIREQAGDLLFVGLFLRWSWWPFKSIQDDKRSVRKGKHVLNQAFNTTIETALIIGSSNNWCRRLDSIIGNTLVQNNREQQKGIHPYFFALNNTCFRVPKMVPGWFELE